MASVNNFSKKTISNNSVNSTGITFTNNIEKFIGRSANLNGRINETEIMDFDVMFDSIDEPEKFINAKGTPEYSTGAKAFVYATSVLYGIVKVGEHIVDGGTWVAGKVVSLFGVDTSSFKEFIARDLTNEEYTKLYEENELFKKMNEKSEVKYNSNKAKNVQKVSSLVTEVALATGLTVLTGGAAAPFVAGTLSGIGTNSEKAYQKNVKTTVLQELGIAGAGILSGLTWVANGKLGKGAIEIGKDIINHGAKPVIKSIAQHFTNVDFIKTQLKNGLSLFKDGKFNFLAGGNYLNSLFGTAKSLTPYITDQKKFTFTDALKITGRFCGYLALSIVEQSIKDYLKTYKAGNIEAYSVLNDVTTNNKEGKSYIERLREWRGKIDASKHREKINGITLISDSEEGLEELKAYFLNSRNSNYLPNTVVEELSEKDVYITNIKMEGKEGSFTVGSFVHIDEKDITMGWGSTLYHELGHAKDNISPVSEEAALKQVVEDLKAMRDRGELDASFTQFKNDYQYVGKLSIDYLSSRNDQLLESIEKSCERTIPNWNDLVDADKEEYRKELLKSVIILNTEGVANNTGLGAISDIFDMLSGGKLQQDGYLGHGIEYYSKEGSDVRELFGNFSDLVNTDKLDLLDRYFPTEIKDRLLEIYNRISGYLKVS